MAKKEKKVVVIEGQPLAEDVLSSDRSVVLCRAGTIMTRELIQRLSSWIVEEQPRRKYEVEEPVFKDEPQKRRFEVLKRLEFEELVNQQTKQELEKGCESFFTKIGGNDQNANFGAIEDSINKLVDETPDNPDMPLKLFEMKQHSSFIFRHSINCGVMASYVANTLNYPQNEVSAFAMAMMLHDTGLLKVSPEILNKTTPPTDEERAQLRGHPKAGFDALKTVPGIDPLVLMVAMGHHLRADGSGYPEELDMNEFPPLVHLASVINDFETLTTDRPFKPAISMFNAIKTILTYREIYHPGALENFIRVAGIFPVTSFVLLNTGEIGVVTRNNQENLFLPEIKLVRAPNGAMYNKEVIVNLLSEQGRTIASAIDHI
jgi:HD-GYP domain-containing protein (c-di-GMP phosphodiesterase class II)